MFQDYVLFPHMNVYENVAFGLKMSGMDRDTIQVRVLETLELVGLVGFGARDVNSLSGGEQQRVAIARAIAKRPEVLLCDEPTGALDSKTGVRVLEALAQINEELGTSTIVITHNAAIQNMAHRVIFFADGQISEVKVNETRLLPHEIEW